MNLTTTEKKLLEQLRRQETWMFRSRYWFVAGGIFCYAAAAYFASLMQHLTQTIGDNPAMGAFLFSFVFPCYIVMGIKGSILLGTAIRDWHGNAIRVLLIKLLDEDTTE